MKKIISAFALVVLPLFLLPGCGGSEPDSEEQAELQSTYLSDFEWAVGQMEDVYDEYGFETAAWRLLEVEEVYITSANEMNGADWAVSMIVEFALKIPGEERWREGGAGQKGWRCGDNDVDPQTFLPAGFGYLPAIPIKFQVASWDGDRQLPCLTDFKEGLASWASRQQ